jgi:hypothetical protein
MQLTYGVNGVTSRNAPEQYQQLLLTLLYRLKELASNCYQLP